LTCHMTQCLVRAKETETPISLGQRGDAVSFCRLGQRESKELCYFLLQDELGK
jgi:hypothetical protein